ncbi:MAG TPA: hypothetical protein VFX45_12535 [Solirubrobacterales bacterium]|nr:hypothetical protein [Solirubrobacterales bacterium]
MRIGSPSSPAQAESARLARIAWLVSFAVTVAVITGLLLIKSAQAAAAPSAALPGTILLDDAEEEDEGFEFEEFDEGEEEDEFEDGPEGGRGGEPPAECGLRTARGAVVADESRSAIRTQVSYTSFDPVDVAIELRLNGRGSLTLWRDHKRLRETGVVHASERLSKGQLAKVMAARNFTLTIKVLDAPRECNRYFDRHLKTRRAVGDQVTWIQSDSVFGG